MNRKAMGIAQASWIFFALFWSACLERQSQFIGTTSTGQGATASEVGGEGGGDLGGSTSSGGGGGRGAVDACSNVADGTPCDDKNGCTQSDVCKAGECVGSDPVSCSAKDQCHVAGVCDPSTGECSAPNASSGVGCDDGNACTQSDTCQNGSCIGASPIVCTALDQCHVAGICNPGTGQCSNPIANNGVGCDDGNACTQSDICQNGTCVGTSPIICTALDQCHVVGTCDPGTGQCSNPNAPSGTACSDSNSCTQPDTCQNGACVGGASITCLAQDQCHTAGVCNPATGQCSNPNANNGIGCNDGNACTQSDTCQNGNCVGANPVACVALDQCHITGTCNSATGQCSNPNASDGTGCNDGSACTQLDACQSGACVGTPIQVNWTAKAPLAQADPTIIAAAVNGQIHVIGWTMYLRHRVFTPATNSWAQKNDLPYDASEGWAGAIGSSLYAIGEGTFGADSAMLWNAASDSWSVLAAQSWPRRLPAGGVINGKIYLAGGFAGNDDKVNVFNPGTNAWTDLAPLPNLAGGVNTGVAYNNKLYVFGVIGGNFNPTQGEVYDPASNSWVSLSSLPQSRYGSRGILVGSTVWLLGGSANGTAQSSIYIYDINSDTWCQGPSLPKPLFLMAVEQVNGKIYTIGGHTTNGTSIADVWEGTIQ